QRCVDTCFCSNVKFCSARLIGSTFTAFGPTMAAEVVITGMGLVSPFGVGIEPALAALARGESAIREGVRVPGLEPAITAALVPVTDRDASPAASYLRAAVEEAATELGEPWGFFVGTCSGAMRDFELWTGGASNVSAGRWYQAPAEAVLAHRSP